MEYTRYDEQPQQFIQKAIAFRDAISQCSVDYQERAKREGLNLEVKDKLVEVSSTGVWAFKGYYNTFSLSKYVSGYYNDKPNIPQDHGDRQVNSGGINEAAITACCAPIDLPIACLAGAVSAGAKLTHNMIKMASESVVYYYQKSAKPDQFQRKSHLGLLQLHVYKIQCALEEKPIKLQGLAQLCHHILMDLSNVVAVSSIRSVSVGEHYLTEPFIYHGLRHYLTGKSHLADMIERNVIWQYHFERDVACFNLPNQNEIVMQSDRYVGHLPENAMRPYNPSFWMPSEVNPVHAQPISRARTNYYEQNMYSNDPRDQVFDLGK